jgi:hypothetical protein
LLGDAARALSWIAGLLEPFLPDTSARIAAALGVALPPVYGPTPIDWEALAAGAHVRSGDVLFARLSPDASDVTSAGAA